MTNRIMAVYDVDPFYADRFADFVNQKEKVPFTVMAFTTLERLKNYAMEHEIEVYKNLAENVMDQHVFRGYYLMPLPMWRQEGKPCLRRAMP